MIDRAKTSQITMVLRGFVGGMKKAGPTMAFIGDILKKDPACDLNKGRCDSYQVNIQIDPKRFQKFHIDEPFREGDYLLFAKRLYTAKTDRLLKKVGCVPGQQLSTVNGEYACDGHFLGRAMSSDSKEQPLPQFVFNGQVPDGSLFMIDDWSSPL